MSASPYTRERYADEMEEPRDTPVRMARPTFSTQHGGKLQLNDVVDVEPSTARRWLRIGLAVDADHPPFEDPNRPQVTVAQLNAEIDRLRAQVEYQERRASGPAVPVPEDPFAVPSALPGVPQPITQPPPGDAGADPADPEDTPAEEPDREQRRSRRR